MTYLFLINKLNNLFTVSRRLRSRLSWRPGVCTVSPAFDWWSASRGVTKNQNSITIVSHRIYLGGCHFNPTFGCQVCAVVVWYFQNFKFALLLYTSISMITVDALKAKQGDMCSLINSRPIIFSSNLI